MLQFNSSRNMGLRGFGVHAVASVRVKRGFWFRVQDDAKKGFRTTPRNRIAMFSCFHVLLVHTHITICGRRPRKTIPIVGLGPSFRNGSICGPSGVFGVEGLEGLPQG